jgi:hypothetical protein
MLICKVIHEKGATIIQHISTCPFVWRKLSKMREQMNTSSNICNWNYTTDKRSISIFFGRDFVEAMIWIGFRKRREPLNICQMFMHFDTWIKEIRKRVFLEEFPVFEPEMAGNE